MMNTKNTYCTNCSKPFQLAILAILLSFVTVHSQPASNLETEIPTIAIENVQRGIYSTNPGVVFSCVYFAGKYKIADVSKDLINVLRNCDCDETSKMAIWSLYQIGDESDCQEIAKSIVNHKSKKLKEFCKFLQEIHEYKNAVTRN